jgi:hypothetical protein
MINLGDEVKDEVTGIQGIVLARMECLYEATSCRVHARNTEPGCIPLSIWLEEDRLQVIKERAVVGFVQVAGRQVPA